MEGEEDNDTLKTIKVKKDGTQTFSLGTQFGVFPNNLLAAIERQLSVASSNHTPNVPIIYEVFTMQRTLSNTDPVAVPKMTSLSLGLAKLAALDYLLEITRTEELQAAQWQRITATTVNPYAVSNPNFSAQHLLRDGDIGWGFDINGWVSVCKPSRGMYGVQHVSAYVVANRAD